MGGCPGVSLSGESGVGPAHGGCEKLQPPRYQLKPVGGRLYLRLEFRNFFINYLLILHYVHVNAREEDRWQVSAKLPLSWG